MKRCGSCENWCSVGASIATSVVDLTDDGLCGESQKYKHRNDVCDMGDEDKKEEKVSEAPADQSAVSALVSQA